MIIFNTVKDEDVPRIKRKGAKWNEQLQKWYSNDEWETDIFREWIAFNEYSEMVIKNSIYILECHHICYSCKEKRISIGLGFKEYELVDELGNILVCDKYIRFTNELCVHINRNILSYLLSTYNFHDNYDRKIVSENFINHCKNCQIAMNDQEFKCTYISCNDIEQIKKTYVLKKIMLAEDIKCDNLYMALPNKDIDLYSTKVK